METKIFDLHNDCLTKRERFVDLIPSNVNAVLAIWTTKLKNPIDLLEKAKKIDRPYAVEDLHFINEHNAEEIICNFAPLYASLTWNNENNLAGGAYSDASLKPLGERVIKILEDREIFFDVAHLNRKSFFKSLDVVSKPIICSHTCFNRIFNDERNLSDEQIEILVEKKGLIGLTFVPAFLGKKRAGLIELIGQIEYFLSKYPIENLAIGSDFFGTKHPALKNYRQFESLKDELIKINYTLEQIDKIFYSNAYNFFNKKVA